MVDDTTVGSQVQLFQLMLRMQLKFSVLGERTYNV